MPQNIRMWEITAQNTLAEISSTGINLEKRLEDWLESDISILDPDLLVIGRQVPTSFGGGIDLLCLDSRGDSVVVELKKGKTPRDVTAQALDYASWAKELSFDQITDIAERYDKLDSTLEEAFQDKFGEPLPDSLNQNHRSLIVAEAMDESTERIVRYLSEMNVPINVATVQHFKAKDGKEMLAQVFLVDPEVAEARAQPASRREPYVTASEMEANADRTGVGNLYRHLREGTSGVLTNSSFGRQSLGFQARLDNRTMAIFIVDLQDSEKEIGLKFRMNGTRLMRGFGLDLDRLCSSLPDGYEDMATSEWRRPTEEERQNWNGFKGYFRCAEEIDTFLAVLKS